MKLIQAGGDGNGALAIEVVVGTIQEGLNMVLDGYRFVDHAVDKAVELKVDSESSTTEHRQVGNVTHPALHCRYQNTCSRISTGSLSKWPAGGVVDLGGSCSVISARRS